MCNYHYKNRKYAPTDKGEYVCRQVEKRLLAIGESKKDSLKKIASFKKENEDELDYALVGEGVVNLSVAEMRRLMKRIAVVPDAVNDEDDDTVALVIRGLVRIVADELTD